MEKAPYNIHHKMCGVTNLPYRYCPLHLMYLPTLWRDLILDRSDKISRSHIAISNFVNSQ